MKFFRLFCVLTLAGTLWGQVSDSPIIQLKDQGTLLTTVPAGLVKFDTSTGVAATWSPSTRTYLLTSTVLPSGTTMSIATTCGITGGTITVNGTVTGSIAVDSQTGSSPFALPSSDCGKLIARNQASAVADTIAQAGTSGFVSGWHVIYECIGAGGCTITPTTSTIDGASSLVLAQHQGVFLVSDGTNYYTFRGVGGSNISTLNGTTFGSSSAADQLPRTTAAGTATWTSVAACTTAGKRLWYDTTTHTFSCHTDTITDIPSLTTGTSLLKGDGAGKFSNAVAGTDYAAATSGSSLLKGNGSGGFNNATYADIVALWSSCTSGFLQYNGTCAAGGGGGSGTPGGSDGQLQINSAGAFAGRDIGTGLLLSGTDLGADLSVLAALAGTNTWTQQNVFSGPHIVSGAGSYTDHSGAGYTAPVRNVTSNPASCNANIEWITNTTDGHTYRCDASGTGWLQQDGSGSPPGSSGNIIYNNAGAFGAKATTGTGNVALSAAPVFTGQVTIPDFTLAGHDHSNAAGGGQISSTAFASGSKQGNGTKFAMTSGTFTAGNCLDTDASGNVIDAGAPCGTGGGGGSGVGRTTLTATWGLIPDGTCSRQTVTWTGVTTADTITLGVPSAATWTAIAFVSASDTVAIQICSLGADVTPGSQTFKATLAVYNLSGTGTINFTSILDGNCSAQSFSLVGVSAGDPVVPKWPATLDTAITGIMYASATDTIMVRLCAVGGDADPPSLTFGASVAK